MDVAESLRADTILLEKLCGWGSEYGFTDAIAAAVAADAITVSRVELGTIVFDQFHSSGQVVEHGDRQYRFFMASKCEDWDVVSDHRLVFAELVQIVATKIVIQAVKRRTRHVCLVQGVRHQVQVSQCTILVAVIAAIEFMDDDQSTFEVD